MTEPLFGLGDTMPAASTAELLFAILHYTVPAV
jgi:hypothetical protein